MKNIKLNKINYLRGKQEIVKQSSIQKNFNNNNNKI